MSTEIVTVIANGVPYLGWKSVQISAAMDRAVREFSLVCTEHPGGFAFPPGTAIQIFAGGDQMVDGFVNQYMPQFDKQSHEVTIQGRSKGQDFTDCAAKKDPSHWENKDAGEIAKDLDLFGVGVKAEVPLDKRKYFHINQGETAFRATERALRDQGATIMADEQGSGIVITNATKAKRHSGGLQEGDPRVLSGKGQLTDDKKHSDYETKGQNRHGRGDANLRISETEKDSTVRRYRPKILINEEDTTPALARKRAGHERDRAAGFSITADFTVQGWRDAGGKIWQPNYLVYVGSPMLKIDGDMLIERVTFKQADGAGTTADIHVVNPKAYKGKGGSSKSDAAWG